MPIYITRLRLQADYCDYDKEGWPAAVKNEMVRDKFVFGLRDDNLKERLLREADISLGKIVALAQRTESSQRHIREMIDNGSNKKSTDTVQVSCGQCGRKHKPRECPAYGQRCSICNKYNHFACVCRSKNQTPPSRPKTTPQTKSKKKLHAVVESQKSTDTEDSDGEPLLVTDALKVHGISESMWLSTISVLGNKITFKLDTGAEASVLPLKVFNCLRDKPMLSNTTTKLSAYGGSLLAPIGTCVLECRGKFATSAVRFFVVSKEVQPILGLKDCTSLGLVQRVHTIQVPDLSKEMIQVEFPDIFKGLGNIGKYRITLKENAIPVIHQARRVPHSLRDKLKRSLDANLKCGVLQKVDEPTDWVHNLVIVEKKNGTLRLCLDPRDLNKVIKREHYRIPTAQEISSKLAGKKVFSTFDLKDGYWQVELDNYSSMLCTFSTHFGRYRFTHMPFDLASASEVFQKKNEAAVPPS